MGRTVGIEEEFLLVHAGTAKLAADGAEVVRVADRQSDAQYEQELMQEQAELGTSPQDSAADLAADLRRRRAELAHAANAQGLRLIAAATSPFDVQATTTPHDRYQVMTEQFGMVARTQLTCGMHVHVAVDSADEGVGVLDRLRPWLAPLVALSANSPFVSGEDTGYASYRSVLWGQWPTAGVTDLFGSVAGYETARAALLSSGAAMDEGMIYFDARLSARYPTVEIRVADVCADASDAVVIALLIRGMVATAATQWTAAQPAPPVRSELLRAASWRAARWGTQERLVDVATAEAVPAWDLIDRLMAWVTPALEAAGDAGRVTAGLADIRRRGTGARLQREAYVAGGMPAVVDMLAARTVA